MHVRRLRRLLLVGAAASLVAVGLTPVTAAYANPPGCTKGVETPYGDSGGTLHDSGWGSCDTGAWRILHLEMKQDIPWQPDPVALRSDDAGTDWSYYASLAGCDHHNYKRYYGRVFFDGYSDYTDSSHVDLQSC